METTEVKTEYELDIGPTEVAFQIIDIPKPAKKISVWSNIETKQLIDLYKSLICKVGPEKKFLHKKDMWREISLQFANKNAKQCEERFKTVQKRKNKDSGHNEKNDVGNIKHVRVWSSSETRQLMDLYKRFIYEVGPQKRFVHKKDMWSKISSTFANKDPKQCEQRYNTLLKRKKNAFKTRRNTTDFKSRTKENKIKIDKLSRVNVRKNIGNMETKEVTTHIEGLMPNSQNTISDLIKIFDEEYTSQKIKSSSTDAKDFLLQDSRGMTLRETLLEIAAKKEEAKQKRHREKMEAFNKIYNILERLSGSKNNV